ncbi:hypothetical protein CN514_24875 [Bacillus sp. AFS001701]|uniref:hypothetical protein n=1 Tax=Bacillaceae TaxID=186817 RepID=UPI000BF5B48D|nr:hypothetical protein [Bacillus sp. AFS001701]PET36028.1 hypothetical protein CN514_24875 [Bacillus sp. AFS001701]
MNEKRKYKIELSSIIYLCSFLVVFPVSLPLYFVLAMGSADPSLSIVTTDMIYYGFLIFISIVGSIVLKRIFGTGLRNKNNKITWSIFVAHFVLIPLSVQFYNYLFFY